MATLAELKTLESDGSLQTAVEVALWKAAVNVQAEDPGIGNHANRLKWAKVVLRDPAGSKDDFLRYLLAANADLTIAQIQSATDSAIESKVADAVDIFADGGS